MLFVIVLVVVLAGMVLSACGSDSGDETGSSPAQTVQGSNDSKDPKTAKAGKEKEESASKPSTKKADSSKPERSGDGGNGKADSPSAKAQPTQAQQPNGGGGNQNRSSKPKAQTHAQSQCTLEPTPGLLSRRGRRRNELAEGLTGGAGENGLKPGECPKGLTDQQCQELKSAFEKAGGY